MLPIGWMYIRDFGIKQVTADPEAIPANVALGEDSLSAPDGLPAYIAAHAKLIQSHLLLPRIAGPQPIPFTGAEEAYLLFVRHSPNPSGNMFHVQNYVRLGTWLGIITLTTPEPQLHAVRPDYDAFVQGLFIMPLAKSEQQG